MVMSLVHFLKNNWNKSFKTINKGKNNSVSKK